MSLTHELGSRAAAPNAQHRPNPPKRRVPSQWPSAERCRNSSLSDTCLKTILVRAQPVFMAVGQAESARLPREQHGDSFPPTLAVRNVAAPEPHISAACRFENRLARPPLLSTPRYLESALGRGQRIAGARIGLDRLAERAGDGLEGSLGHMMRIIAVQRLDMEVHPRIHCKSREEFAHQFGIEAADRRGGEVHL